MSKIVPVWRIKYLPKNLDEICGRNEIQERLNLIIEQRNFPHLLFVGPKGIGKTLIATLFSKNFLGEFHEANFRIEYADVPLTSEEVKQAKSEAYISTNKIGSLAGKTITAPAFIQVKIKPFVQLKAFGEVPFKILIVKNFEALGSNQQGFRRLMETYGSNCRMILITEKLSAIIDPIISRCQLFLISPPSFQDFKNLIKKIATNENLQLEDDTIAFLYRSTDGRMAQALDLLQLCSISASKIDANSLAENVALMQKDLIRSLLLRLLEGDFEKSREISRKIQNNYKVNAQQTFLMLFNELNRLPLSVYAKADIMNIIAEADFRSVDGRDIDIQLSNLLAQVCHYSNNL